MKGVVLEISVANLFGNQIYWTDGQLTCYVQFLHQILWCQYLKTASPDTDPQTASDELVWMGECESAVKRFKWSAE